VLGELFTVTLTLVLSLIVGVEIGLLSGVFLDVAFVVQRTARPILSFSQCESLSGIQFTMLKPRHSLLVFPATEYLRTAINSAIAELERSPSFIVIDFRNVQELDYTAAKGIGSLKKELMARGILLVVLGSNEGIKLVLKASLKAQNVIQAKDDTELDVVLQEQRGGKELRDVIAPLLQQNNDELKTERKESLRRE
jgi:sodium-independent sulfate anion transporter 11